MTEIRLTLNKLLTWVPVVLGGAVLVVVLLLNLLVSGGSQHYYFLSQAFLQGKLYFLADPWSQWADTALWAGHHFWPLGPLPALLLLPLVSLPTVLQVPPLQGLLQFCCVALTCFAVFHLSRSFGYKHTDAHWFWFTFLTSAYVYVAMIPISHHLAHVVAVALWFLALAEYGGRRRYWLLGLFCGLVLATRAPAALGIVFFALDALLDRATALRVRYKCLLELLTPLLISVFLLAVYNYSRFGNAFEQGYLYQLLSPALTKARDYGLFSLVHLPGNLYYLLLAVPQPVFRETLSHVLRYPFVQANPWGLSLFVTSPYLFQLCRFNYRTLTAKLALVGVVVILAPLLLYYGVGYWQFGYRYALDFMPLLFWLFMREYRAARGDLTVALRWVMLGSALVNLYLIVTYDYSIPV